MSVGIDRLGEDTKESDISEALRDIQHAGGAKDLTTAIGIVQKIVPLYTTLSKETKSTLFLVVSQSQIVLSQLVAYTSNLKEDRDASRRRLTETLYKSFIIDVLRGSPDFLYQLVCSAEESKMDRQQLKSLFFGSRMYNLLSSDLSILEYLAIMNTQWQYISLQIQNGFKSPSQMKYLADLTLSELDLSPLHASTYLFDALYLRNGKDYESFQFILKHASRIDSKRILVNYVVPYLESKMTPDNIDCIARILHDASAFKFYDSMSLLRIKSVQLQEVIVRHMPPVTANNVFRSLLSKFGMIMEDLDENISQLLVMLLQYTISDETKFDMSHDSEFLETVTKRLGNTDSKIRERTMFIAKILARGELKYESDFSITIPKLDMHMDTSAPVDLSVLHEDTTQMFGSVNETTQRLGMLTFQRNDEPDSDDEEEDEQQTEIRQIVFIKDLVGMYTSQSKGKRVESIPLLKRTVQLVRQKQHLPLEVGYYASSLLSSVSTLNNSHEEDNFEQWRVNALVAVLVVVPDEIAACFKILFNTELSIQQRISLLSAIALAARELRGLEDEHTYKPAYDFPSMRLPWDKQQIESDATTPAIEDVQNSGISEGVTVWKSQKLTLEKDKKAPNRFSKISAQFFYPLIHGWKNGIDLGSFDQLFKTHYISTLRIVHNCAFPTNNYEQMTQELEEIIIDAQMQGVPLAEQ